MDGTALRFKRYGLDPKNACNVLVRKRQVNSVSNRFRASERRAAEVSHGSVGLDYLVERNEGGRVGTAERTGEARDFTSVDKNY